MDRATATEQLKSDSPHERLKAAQFFAKNYNSADLAMLRDARSRESVAYVKKRLDVAIERASSAHFPDLAPAPPEPEIGNAIRKEVWGKAVQEISGNLLHELEPRIGQIRDSAKAEIPDFAASKTKRHLDHLERIFEGITSLRIATATPRIEEFDLALLIRDIIAEEASDTKIQISDQGPRPFLIRSDPRLLTLAISNGLRNAIEAVGHLPEGRDRQPIVINWDRTDVDYWVVILDQGPGLIGPPDAAFAIGRTTKKGHIGFGLSIARQAMDSLEGSATLSVGKDAGAKLELRWDR